MFRFWWAAVLLVVACGSSGRSGQAIGESVDARKVAPADRSAGVDAAVQAAAPDAADVASREAMPPPTMDARAVSVPADAADGAAAFGPGVSPGSVVLRLVLPAGRSYCDQRTLCDPQTHIGILDSTGKSVSAPLPYCPIYCNSFCAPPPCVGIPCVPMGFAFTGEERLWDGRVYSTSTCGMAMTCYEQRWAAPGRYQAVMCATPGQVVNGDGGTNPTCQAAGTPQCVTVAFDFPSSTPVVGTLP